MDIYTDYANWKFENYDFLKALVDRKSKTIARFTSVIAVVDYLYEQYLKTKKLTEDDNVFFEIGFDYIHDHFYTIKTILEFQFKNDYDEMDKCAPTINLLLYTQEFQAELLNQDIDLKQELAALDEFEQEIVQHLDQKTNVPDTYFPMLNDIINPIFERYQFELNPIESIFYEAALEYGIFIENDFDIFNTILAIQKNGKKL